MQLSMRQSCISVVVSQHVLVFEWRVGVALYCVLAVRTVSAQADSWHVGSSLVARVCVWLLPISLTWFALGRSAVL